MNGWIRENTKKWKKKSKKRWIDDLNRIICLFVSINGRDITAYRGTQQRVRADQLIFCDNLTIKQGGTLSVNAEGYRLFIYCKGTVEINGKFGSKDQDAKNGSISMNGKVFGSGIRDLDNKYKRDDEKWNERMETLIKKSKTETVDWDTEMIKLCKIGGKTGRAPAIQIDGRCGKGIWMATRPKDLYILLLII